MRKILLFILLITNSLGSFAQKKFDFRFWEDSLINLRNSVLYTPDETKRISLNEEFMSLLEFVLQEKDAFSFDWSAVTNFSVLTSPDNLFKLFTWYIIKDNFTYENFGFIHIYNADRKKYILYPLYDNRKKIPYPNTAITDINKWYGAVYYKIIPLVDKEKTYYTLLGWNGNDIFTNEKIIEVMQFKMKSTNPITFGAKIFSNYQNRAARIILQYSKNSSLSLNYEKQSYNKSTGKRDPKTRKLIYETVFANMIIFEELIPIDDDMPDTPAFLVPESSLNQGFIVDNGKWLFLPSVNGRNPDKPLPLRNIRYRNYYNPR